MCTRVCKSISSKGKCGSDSCPPSAIDGFRCCNVCQLESAPPDVPPLRLSAQGKIFFERRLIEDFSILDEKAGELARIIFAETHSVRRHKRFRHFGVRSPAIKELEQFPLLGAEVQEVFATGKLGQDDSLAALYVLFSNHAR